MAKRAGLIVKLIPTPRELSSDCGIALRFDWADRKTIEQLLAEVEVDYEVHESKPGGT